MKNKLFKNMYLEKFNLYFLNSNFYLIGYLINKNLNFFKRYQNIYFFFFKYRFFFLSIFKRYLLIPYSLIFNLFSLYKAGLPLIIFFFNIEYNYILKFLKLFNKKFSSYVIVLLVLFENYVVYRKNFLKKCFTNKEDLLINLKYFFFKNIKLLAKIA